MKKQRQLITCMAVLASASACETGPTMDSFAQQVAKCESASFTTAREAGARGTYSVEGPGDDGCRVAFTYTENPNAELKGKAVTFTVDPQGNVGRQLKAALTECLEGRNGDFHCEGPLFAAVGGMPPGEAAGPLPCGETVAESGKPLYPLPRDGAWGYVDAEGNWVIEPAWDRAGDFHEGRAIVARNGGWGVIDRQGKAVLEPRLRPQSFSRVDGRRVGYPPLKPFSENCAAGVGNTAGKPPFFVHRDGRIYWQQGSPETLANFDVREFGSFSEGLAWFRVPGEIRSQYGWIDAKGDVVIEPEYQYAGRFVDGLAPASIKSGQAGFIDKGGKITLPGKWTLDSAGNFSEGWAYVSFDAFEWAYISREEGEIRQVSLPNGDTAELRAGGQFRDGLAPVRILEKGKGMKLMYITTRGQAVLTPDELDGIKVCSANPPPEFHQGLVRLLVANDGANCGDADGYGFAEYKDAHYRYLNRDGETVLSSAGSEGQSG